MYKLFRWAKPYKFLLTVILILSLIIPITYSYVPQFIKYVVDIVFERNLKSDVTLPGFTVAFFKTFTNPLDAALVVGIVLLVYQSVRASLLFLNGYIKGLFAEKITYDMRNQLYGHIQNLSYTYHSDTDAGDLIQRCTSDVDTIKSFISAQFPQVMHIIGSMAAGIYQLSFISVELMLVTLAVVPIVFVTSLIYFKYVRKKFDEVELIESDLTTVIQENVNGVRVVKAFAMEKHEIERFDKQNKQFRDESRNLNSAMALFWGLSDGIIMVQYGATVIAAIFLNRNGAISTGDIMAGIMYISMLVYPIRGLARIIGDFGKAIVASKRVDEILSIPDEYAINGDLKPVINGDIVFDNVSFKFDDTEKHLLNGVTFAINKGETVAIVGKTGSGKSTIANLLVRMLEYNKGSIKINGVELKDIEKHHIRNNIGIILQEPFLYAKTISENIRIANDKIDLDNVYRAANAAAVHKDIVEFNLGYETVVGEKGITLSGGQKQRISIARMLILEKPVIIFDDSLSAVDTKTDVEIRNALKSSSKEMTSIIITHRITTAKEADKIIVLEGGVVSAIGTHEELANMPGLYQSLWKIQGSLEEEFTHLVKDGGEVLE